MITQRSLIAALALTLVTAACGGSATTTTITARPPDTTSAAPATVAPDTTTTTTTTSTVPETTTTVDLAEAEAIMREQIAEMIDVVEGINRRDFVTPPAVIIGTPTQMRERLQELIWEETTEEDLRISGSTLAALGVIEPDFDWVAEYVELATQSVLGFYDPDTDELWVVNLGSEFGPGALSIVVHELQHALQDQVWDLSRFDVLWESQLFEQYDALSGLIEGEATFVEDEFINTFTERQRLEYNNELASFSSGRSLPPFLSFVTSATYKDGRGFVGDLYEEGGWDAVAAVWENPPITTEQMKHTERYFEGEQPIDVQLPDISLDGFEVVEEAIWGENDFIGMFSVENVGAPGVFAATNWGGDRYRILWDGTTAVFVLEVVGDDPEATANFLEALTIYGDSIDVGDDRFAVFESGGSVFVVASVDEALVAEVVAQVEES